MAPLIQKVEVKVTELEVMKGLCEIMLAIIKDERIPESIREEYTDKVNELLEIE